MKRRTFEEMITYFNQTVSEMDIDRKYKMKLLGMITAIYQKYDEDVQHWIPCSERLPEDGQDVLFCDIDEDIMLGYHVKGRPNTHFTQCGSWDEIKNVFAWMPLPEPWRGEEHGQSRE